MKTFISIKPKTATEFRRSLTGQGPPYAIPGFNGCSEVIYIFDVVLLQQCSEPQSPLGI